MQVMPAGGSPFEAVLRHQADLLPQQFVNQYLVGPDDSERALLVGTMERIWHRPKAIWPLLRMLAVLDIIFPEQGTNVPATMTVEGFWASGGRPAQTWRRSFALPTTRRFDAVMSFDSEVGRVVEWLRPWQLIEVVWEVAFEPPSTMRITAERMRIGRGSRRVSLPTWLTPSVIAVETAVGDQDIAIKLLVSHAWLRDFFGYEGRFRVTREASTTRTQP